MNLFRVWRMRRRGQGTIDMSKMLLLLAESALCQKYGERANSAKYSRAPYEYAVRRAHLGGTSLALARRHWLLHIHSQPLFLEIALDGPQTSSHTGRRGATTSALPCTSTEYAQAGKSSCPLGQWLRWSHSCTNDRRDTEKCTYSTIYTVPIHLYPYLFPPPV